VVLDGLEAPALQAARSVATTNALVAELEAALLCLGAMLAAGITRARLHVDALGVLRAFQGKLALKFCVQEARLLHMAGEFEHLEVRLVPRAFNDQADRLAAEHLATEPKVH
jgi:ribonuclease HI